MKRDKCLICGSDKLNEVINLGSHSYADTFVKKENYYNQEDSFILSCDLCDCCGNNQISSMTDPKKRYSSIENEYSYTMSNSDFSRCHWNEFAKEMISRFSNVRKNDSILEIGSNDGYLLKQFMDMGYKNVYGVDPSNQLAELAKKNGVETLVDLFPFTKSEYAMLMALRGAKLIIACNILNHSDDPISFVRGIYNTLDDDGVFVFEVLDWFSSFKSFRFDQIYAEHIINFTANSCANLLQRSNMYIDDIEIVDYHGGSIRIYAKKNDGMKKHNEKLEKLVHREVVSGLYDKEYYKFFMNHIKNQRNRFMKKIFDLKSKGESIVTIGAAAKGNSFLNFYRLDASLVDYVTDSSDQKKGKFTPLTKIPIVGDEILSKYGKVYALILSWNISSRLKENLLKINPQIVFISPEDQDE